MRKTTRRMICNNNNNHHYIKKNMLRNKLQKELIFPTKSSQREQVDKQWLQIYMGRKCILFRMIRLFMSLLQQNIAIMAI
jgi:hypothetical protein